MNRSPTAARSRQRPATPLEDAPGADPGVNAAAPWTNRITGYSEEDPEQLLANPRNWRTHPARQREALRGALSTVGWVTGVIVNDRTGHVVDGHARIEEAISAGARVPVTHVDLTEEEEGLVLATLDPLGAWAGTDRDRLSELLAEVSVDNEGLALLLADVGDDGHDLTFDERMAEWSGMPAYDSADLSGVRRIVVNFKSEEDVRAFETAVGQTLGAKRSIWFPEVKYEEAGSTRFASGDGS